jgi:phage terminase small subunit
MRTRQYIRKKSVGLNVRQQNFVNEYLIDLNGPKAAIRAFYKPEGAYMQAYRLLKNVKVAAAIQRAKNLRNQRVEISQDQTIQGIAFGCQWDIVNMVDEKNAVKNFRDMDFITRRGIAGFKVTESFDGPKTDRVVKERVTEVRLVDRREYLELLGRHQGLFKDELTVKHEFSNELARVVGGGIDLSKFSDQELAEFNARIAGLVHGGGPQRALQEGTPVLAPEPHNDTRRPLEGEGDAAARKVPE